MSLGASNIRMQVAPLGWDASSPECLHAVAAGGLHTAAARLRSASAVGHEAPGRRTPPAKAPGPSLAFARPSEERHTRSALGALAMAAADRIAILKLLNEASSSDAAV